MFFREKNMEEKYKNYVCEICGGELKETGTGRFSCPYCRTEYFKELSLPEELVLDLYSANRARSLQRFEDALNEYDRIIAAYPDCFDAYWGATLSDYGIQYEKDYDGKMIPTIHRFSEIPVTENKYYVNAVKYYKNKSELARITASAAEIEKIRSEIEKTVGTQEPYDIFLCYKETPIGGSGFTPEFYWANELYVKLRSEGYKVFFAKESLPAAKGDYEAHIFPALKSAKLMLILTSSVENVETVWVKNEWSRFIRFARENPSEGKRFKVIGSGFKPELLPRELKKEQMLNHDSIGWGEQLYEVIKDTFRDKEKEEAERRKHEADEQAANLSRMFEEERKRWAADEQKKREEEERNKRETEERRQREALERQQREEAERQQAAERTESEYGVKAGDCIKLGSYFQDSDTTKAEIEWLVLDIQDGKALLVSKYALDCQKYNETETDVTWESCSLRKWLNNEFLNTAFSNEEQALIPTVTVPVDRNPSARTRPGGATKDKIFLLGISETDKYFSSKDEKACAPTEHAISNGVYIDNKTGNCEWWVRTPGAEQSIAASVSFSGVVNYYGTRVNGEYNAVRPAMWITLEKEAEYIEKKLKDGFYMGYAKDDIPNGKGVMDYTWHNFFDGIFKNGEPFYGKMTYSSGDVYEGEFNERGQPHGKGKMSYDYGDVYEGDFVDGEKHGKGKMTFDNGNIYEGDFVKDKINGKGRMSYNSTVEEDEQYAAGNVYEGDFSNTFMHGKGKMWYANGNFYEGELQNDWKSGFGRMTYTNGITYEGEWHNDRRHGKAKLIFRNGDVFTTKYKKDKPKRRGKMTFASGKNAKGKVVNGVFKKTLF